MLLVEPMLLCPAAKTLREMLKNTIVCTMPYLYLMTTQHINWDRINNLFSFKYNNYDTFEYSLFTLLCK